MQDLKPTDLNAFYSDLLDHGRRDHGRKADAEGLSKSTVIKIHSLLHEALAAAVRWGIIVRNRGGQR